MKTLVVKIGTSTLVREGAISDQYIADLARQVAMLRAEGWQVVLVSSGAVRAGLDALQNARAKTLAEKQAAAAIGQSLLMNAYRQAFAAHELHVAQLLLTRADTADRRRFLNARHTFQQLFGWNVVPIVNENDTVATEEIKVGDNDTLASLTALVAEADRVLLLSDVDGFYLPGQTRPEREIPHITPEVEAAAGGAGSIGGTGGMRTKIEAARIATRAGLGLVIAHGRETDILLKVARGEDFGTRFLPSSRLRSRKSWIAHGRRLEGIIHLNPCARVALVDRGSSLLPVGIETVEGEFEPGALVLVRDERGEIGRGLVNLSSSDLRTVAGHKSGQIPELLGRAAAAEAIHRDNFSLTASSILKSPTPTVDEILLQLVSICPNFEAQWKEEEKDRVWEDGPPTFCSLFGEFTNFVRDNFAQMPSRKQKELMDFIESCVVIDGQDNDLDTAVCTCFLENLSGEPPLSDQLRTYMGPKSTAFFDQWDQPSIM
jgi:glutamate 5-kinase